MMILIFKHHNYHVAHSLYKVIMCLYHDIADGYHIVLSHKVIMYFYHNIVDDYHVALSLHTVIMHLYHNIADG